MSGAFTDKDAFGIAAYQIQNLIGNQPVIDDDVCLLDQLQAFECEQSGIARTGTDQRYFTLLRKVCAKKRVGNLIRAFTVAVSQRLGQPFAVKKALPEVASGIEGAELLFHPIAQAARQLRQLTQMLRQHRLQFLPQQPRQHRRASTGRDGDHQR